MPCGAWKQPAWPNPPLTTPDGEPAPARSQRPYQQAADTPDQPPLNANRSNPRHRRRSRYTIPDYLRGHRAGSSASHFTGLPNTYIYSANTVTGTLCSSTAAIGRREIIRHRHEETDYE